MRMVGFMRAASVAALVAFDSGATLAQGTDLVTVTVVGSGANEAEARLDAIRQATQQVASQVVVAERLISDDEVVYDNVMSTMNGFVHDFTELSVKKSETEVQIEAEIIVSGNLMRDFAEQKAVSIDIDGSGLFAEMTRANAQAEVHQRMFESIWRRHTDGISAEIQIKDYTVENASFDVEVKWSSSFILSLNDFFAEIAYVICPSEGYGDPREVIEASLKFDPLACVIRKLTPEAALERFKKSKELAEYVEYGYHSSFDHFCSRGVCYAIDRLSIYPLISSRIPFYKANVWEEQPLYITQHTSDSDLKVSKGTDPFGLKLKIYFFDDTDSEVKSFTFSVPLTSLTRGRVDTPTDEYLLWGSEFKLQNARFTVKIPLLGFDIQRVNHASVEVLD